mmetsp:Transcript_14277/g.20274  ORF Transcript_14277/g.20274 Transcript_14277/m.20274 type:complete len:99 (+) Transcript_14277:75-371(+)
MPMINASHYCTLHLSCPWNSSQLFRGMTIPQNKAFIAQCTLVRTIYLHGNVGMTGRIGAPNHVIRTQMQLFSVTNNTLVVAAIPFVSVPTTNPDTIFC